MMNLFRSILLNESHKTAQKEAEFSINTINSVYNEWKKIKRRINAVDIVTTSVNKIIKIHPSTIHHIHDTAKLKLSIILMRVMDLPIAKNAETKKSIYKKIFPLLDVLQSYIPNTGSGGNLREIIMTRLSSNISHENDSTNKTFVSYEPTTSLTYLTYLFGDNRPKHVFKMQALRLPEDFDTLLNVLRINYDKALAKVNKEKR